MLFFIKNLTCAQHHYLTLRPPKIWWQRFTLSAAMFLAFITPQWTACRLLALIVKFPCSIAKSHSRAVAVNTADGSYIFLKVDAGAGCIIQHHYSSLSGGGVLSAPRATSIFDLLAR
jgi:hypothetical protein